MITWALPVDPKDGKRYDLMCPVVTCDACGESIDADRPGHVVYNGLDRSQQMFTHKGPCDYAMDSVLESHGWEILWDDLGDYLGQLLKNYTDPLVSRDRDYTLFSGTVVHPRSWDIVTGAEGGKEQFQRQKVGDR